MPFTEDSRGKRARELRDRAREAPTNVDPVEPLSLLESPQPSVRRDAIEALREIAEAKPKSTTDAIPRLIALLGTTDQQAEVHILEAAAAVASVDPEAVAPSIMPIINRIELRSSTHVLQAATKVLAEVATEYPEVTIDAVPRLAVALDHPDPRVKRNVLAALSKIAETYPEEIRPLVDELERALEEDDERVIQAALATLGRLLSQYPMGSPHLLDMTLHLAEHDAVGVRANAMGLLGDYLRHEEAEDTVILGRLLDALEDRTAMVRTNAMTAIGRIAVKTPDLVIEHADTIESCLDDVDPRVRERACFALGAAQVHGARAILSSIAKDDPDEDVRQRASWALERVH